MNESQIAKIRIFLGDIAMQETVRKAIYASFMKKREVDVSYLAAQMLAIQLLEEAWKDLENQRLPDKQKLKTEQVGL